MIYVCSGHDGAGRGSGFGHYGERGRGRGGYRGRGRGGFGSSDGLQSKFKKSYSSEVIEQAEQLYGKKFKFVDEYDQWKLPDLPNWFRKEVEPFQVEELLETKKQLKEVKSRLDDVELSSWLRHTQFSNQTGVVTPAIRRDYEPEMCSQVCTEDVDGSVSLVILCPQKKSCGTGLKVHYSSL